MGNHKRPKRRTRPPHKSVWEQRYTDLLASTLKDHDAHLEERAILHAQIHSLANTQLTLSTLLRLLDVAERSGALLRRARFADTDEEEGT